MADPLQFPYTSDETSDDGPALAVLNGRLYIAWVGSGNQHLNVMPSVDLANGVVGFDSNAKVVIDRFETGEIQSLGGPALTGLTADGENLLLLAWTLDAGGSNNSMFGIYLNESFARRGELASLDTSDDGPALANWSDVNGINTAFTGRGNRQLNVMSLMDTFSKTISNETSPYRPALCTSRWPNYSIYIAWTGEGDGELNTMHCDGDPFVGAPPTRTEFNSSTKHTYSGETSPSAPGIAGLGKGLYVAWRGDGNDQINVMGIDQGSPNTYKQTSGQTTQHHPAVIAFRDKLFVAWTGQDDHLNLAQMDPVYDPHA